MYSESEVTPRYQKFTVSLWVAGIFSSRFVATASQWINHSFLVAPRGYENISRNTARTYLGMGGLGHLLVCPIRCVATFEDLTVGERDAIFELQSQLKKVLTKLFGAEGFNQAWNHGKAGGQSVPHFHLHLIPRKTGDEGITEYEPRKFLYRPGSRAETPEKELQEISELIRKELYMI
ncbi:MAG: HIT domain-containing protein [Patescibacteria group bacterium]